GRVTITVSDPTTPGTPCIVPANDANGVKCAATGLSSATAGDWKVEFDTVNESQEYQYTLNVRDAASTVVTGRIWTGLYDQYQSGASTQSYWIATREGYL